MVSSTLLTLLVIPAIYSLWTERSPGVTLDAAPAIREHTSAPPERSPSAGRDCPIRPLLLYMLE